MASLFGSVLFGAAGIVHILALGARLLATTLALVGAALRSVAFVGFCFDAFFLLAVFTSLLLFWPFLDVARLLHRSAAAEYHWDSLL